MEKYGQKKKQEWKVSHHLALKCFQTFLFKFEDCSQFIALPPTAAFTTAFQLQASFQSILLPRHSHLQIYISIGFGYMEFQNQHVIGAIVFYTSPERATFMLLKPCFVIFSLFFFFVQAGLGSVLVLGTLHIYWRKKLQKRAVWVVHSVISQYQTVTLLQDKGRR